MNSAEISDMVSCLQEICVVYSTPASAVPKLVLEDLRHLDNAVVLGLVKARADFNGRGADHWTKILRYCTISLTDCLDHPFDL